jgi:hypothetical protein
MNVQLLYWIVSAVALLTASVSMGLLAVTVHQFSTLGATFDLLENSTIKPCLGRTLSSCLVDEVSNLLYQYPFI